MSGSRAFGFRVEGGGDIGMGHLMRCFALAETCRRFGHEAVFLSTGVFPALRRRLSAAGVAVSWLGASYPDPLDLERTVAWARAREGVWLVLDGYRFDAEYQHALRKAGCRVLVVDDGIHAERYYADAVLNQNPFAERLSYPCEGSPRLLLGAQYALIRRDVVDRRPPRRPIADRARRVMVTLGGSDPRGQTDKVLQGLRSLRMHDLDVRVVVGPGTTEVAPADGPSITVLRDPDVAAVMAWADLAISAAGSTCWELACIGVPALVIVVAENQRAVAAAVEEAGLARSLGWWEALTAEAIGAAVEAVAVDAESRRAMSEHGRALVDGRGAERVLAALMN